MTHFFGTSRGATSYEGWIWRFYARMPYASFFRVGCRPTVGFDWGEDRAPSEMMLTDFKLFLLAALVGGFIMGCLL